MTKAKKNSSLKSKRILFVLLLALIIAATIYVLFVGGRTVFYVEPREQRIKEIFSSLNLSDKYIIQDEEISGEKRVYEYDSSRSFSSYREYLRAATLSDTVKELDGAIKAAGFTFTDEPYAGSVGSTQYHYKSNKNEYVRLSVTSKPRMDAFQNFALMNSGAESFPESIFEIDPNAGPSKVTIKVNLDDNNE